MQISSTLKEMPKSMPKKGSHKIIAALALCFLYYEAARAYQSAKPVFLNPNAPVQTPAQYQAQQAQHYAPQNPQYYQPGYSSYGSQNTGYEKRRNILLGVQGSYARTSDDAKLDISGADSQTHSLKEHHPGLGLRAGYIISEKHRILMELTHYFKQNGFSYDTLTLGYAFTPAIPNMPRWRALLGAEAGFAFANFDSNNFNIEGGSMGGLKYNGITYGVRAGAIYELPNGSEIEGGFFARRMNLGSANSAITTENGDNLRADLDLSGSVTYGIYFAYNYLF